MAKDDAALKDQATEIDDILKDGKKKPLNFALMKAKEGVVLKAHPLKSAEVMQREAKAAGGMPAISCLGVLNVVGKTMELRVDAEDAPQNLPKLAKKHFAGLGVLCKVVMILPGGVTVDGDVEDDEDTGDDDGQADDPDAALKAELTDRLKALIPQVREAAAGGLAGADRLGAAVKAAAADIAGGALDRAAKLLDAVEAGLKPGGEGKDDDAARSRLASEFDGLSDKLQLVLDGAEPGVAGKAQQMAQLFATAIDSDLGKAAKVLAMLGPFLAAESGKLSGKPRRPEKIGGFFDDLVKGVSDLGDKISEGVSDLVTEGEKVVQSVSEVVGSVKESVSDMLTSDEEKQRIAEQQAQERPVLEALGLTGADLDRALSLLKDDPKAIEKLKKERLTTAGVPAERQDALMAMSLKSPKAFAAALMSLGAMEKDGKVDVAPAEVQKALEAMEASRKDAEAKRKQMDAAAKTLTDKQKLLGEAGSKLGLAQEASDKAVRDIEALKLRVGDRSKLSMDEQLKLAEESRGLIKANNDAKLALEKAVEAQKQAATEEADAAKKNTAAGEAFATSDKASEADRKAVAAKDGKKALLDAMAFGPLSGAGAMADEDKTRFADAFGKNPAVATRALGVAATSKDPALVARKVGMVADKTNDGFADATGKAMDLPEADRLKMAENALRMGADAGEDYFRGFEEYLKSGKQLQPDPAGGLDGPLADPKAEAKRLNAVALARTRTMGAAAIKDDGTVDFESDKARAAMDDMMFHPGALKTFTPQMTQKMAETKALFSDPATKDKAQATIKDTKLPPTTAPGHKAATTLVGGTLGKDTGAVTDNDAKASVLSAMMTPLSQGPVGSCFSTAPVRAIRETDPLRAMDEYASIAKSGQYTDKAGNIYPANTRLPEGENPLMRSWEYSVATAAAEESASYERQGLRDGLMGGGTPPGSDLTGVKDIVGDFKWQDKTAFGRIIPGVESKLKSAMASELKFDYNAGPQVGGPAGGGGDGHSTDGAYEITYKGKSLTTEAAFIDAIKSIALSVTKETEATPAGQQIVTLVTSPAFRDSIVATGGSDEYLPWKLGSGGFEDETHKALDGGSPQITDVFGANTTGQSEGERTEALIAEVLAAQTGGGKDMMFMATRGTDANHGFNTLPNDPSLDKIKGPDPAKNIKDALVKPGEEMAKKKLPAEQAAKMFVDQIRAAMEGKPGGERDLLVAALKKRPTVEMTPAEIKAKVANEMTAWRDVAAQRELDAWFESDNKDRAKKGIPERPPSTKAGFLGWFKNNIGDKVKSDMDTALITELQPPEIVIADTNWGGPENQVFFVAAPDPATGELKMWKKTMPGSKMTPLGKNWADAEWSKL